MHRELAAWKAAFIWLACFGSQVTCQDNCNQPKDISGTRHNGSLAEYPPGTVLLYSCETGYNPNHDKLTAVCFQNPGGNSGWNPTDFKCELDYVSLVVAIIVALVGIIIFALAVAWLLKRRHERDSRRIKRKQREASHKRYEQRQSTRNNNYDNPGMTDIEMSHVGQPIANGNVGNGHVDANGLYWSPPEARGSVKQETEVTVLQRNRKSSTNSRAGNHNDAVKSKANGIQLNPDHGDIEFGAPNTTTQNFKDIGSTVTAMAPPTMGTNPMEMSLPMPDATSPAMTTTDGNDASLPPPPSSMDFNNLYASVDYSSKTSSKKGRPQQPKMGVAEKKQNNADQTTPPADEEDSGYASVRKPTAHEEAIGMPDFEGDYAEVPRVEDVDRPGNKKLELDFGDMYAKVKK